MIEMRPLALALLFLNSLWQPLTADDFDCCSCIENKLSVASWVERVDLYGDIRLRHRFADTRDQTPIGLGGTGHNERSQFVYRVRLGATVHFDACWSSGMRIETNSASDTNDTNLGGFFDRVGDEAYFGLFYLEYDGYFNVLIGKHQHPFLLDDAFWDRDIMPEGISERYVYCPCEGEWSLAFNAGQYIIDNEDERKTNGLAHVADDLLLIAQAELSVPLCGGCFRMGPMFMMTTGGQTSAGSSETGDIPNNGNASPYFHDFKVILLPVEYSYYDSCCTRHQLFGTFGYNIDGKKLNRNPSFGDGLSPDKDKFFNIGYLYGEAKEKCSWEAGIEYRYIEAASYSPNLSDSDFAKNAFNQQGVVVQGKYALADWAHGRIAYFYSSNIESSLDTDVSPYHVVHFVITELGWRF